MRNSSNFTSKGSIYAADVHTETVSHPKGQPDDDSKVEDSSSGHLLQIQMLKPDLSRHADSRNSVNIFNSAEK